jgi:dolichol-phosphate mannosyltransferase
VRPEDLSVILFAFNEEDNIGPVLRELRAWLDENEPGAEIVFVDDGSTDGTAAAAERALEGTSQQVIRHEHNQGIGAALKTGVRAARGSWITFLPADGQIAPEAIKTLRRTADERKTDVVFSVYADRDDGLHRKVLSAGVRTLIWAIHGVRMRSDGPYLFRRELFDPDQLRPNTFFLNFEFPIRVVSAGVPAAVATIECRPRRAGRSKSTGWRRILGVARDLVELRLCRPENYLRKNDVRHG